MASALAASPVTSRLAERRSVFQQATASRAPVAVSRQRGVVSCAAAKDSSRMQNLVAASAAALLLAIPYSGPAVAAPLFDLADVTGTEQSDRTGLGPNEVDRKDLQSLPNASPKDAAVPAIQKVAQPGKKQAAKPVPKELKQGVEGALTANKKGKGAEKSTGGKTELIGSAGPSGQSPAMQGFFSRLRGGK